MTEKAKDLLLVLASIGAVAGLVLVFCLAGCGGKTNPGAASSVASIQTTALPVAPEVADTEPAARDVQSAKADATNAQQDVRTATAAAQASPETPLAKQVLPPLADADTHLTNAGGKLDAAVADIATLKNAVQASEAARIQREKTIQGDLDALRKAAGEDAKAQAAALETETKAAAKLAKENDDLKNEVIRATKQRLMWIGLGLLLLSIGGFVGFLYGFTPGRFIAGLAAALGVACITLANLLSAIVFWTEIAAGVAFVGVAVYLGYKLFKHQPLVPVVQAVAAEVKAAVVAQLPPTFTTSPSPIPPVSPATPPAATQP